MMAMEPRWAPYCPPATLLSVVQHYVRRDVPAQITKEELRQVGVPDGLVNRTWQGLTHLRLLEEDGTTTDNFRALRFAADDERPRVLQGILRQAYENIFEVIDPATASEAAIDRAFVTYTPGAQRGRMITLFLALCREAGIEVANPPKQRPTQMQSNTRPRPPRGAAGVRRPPVVPPPAGSRRRDARDAGDVPGADAPLVAWFNTRPSLGTTWPKPARERWGKTFMAIVDGLYDEDPWTTSDEAESEGGGE